MSSKLPHLEIRLLQAISALLYRLNRMTGRSYVRLEAFAADALDDLRPILSRSNLDPSCEERVDQWYDFLSKQEQLAAHAALPVAFALGAAGPSEIDLASAPVLSEWAPVRLRCAIGARLIGSNEGHPHLLGKLIVTSQLCGFDRERHWARTLSRWYRLHRFVSFEELAEIHGPNVFRLPVDVLTIEAARDLILEDRERILMH